MMRRTATHVWRWHGARLLLVAAALPASAAHAQLDASCTVSALNRTAPVDAEGVWVLPNVPANLGLIRVRATCVRDGVVRSGASSLISVPASGVIEVADIVFQGPPPIPTSVRLEAPRSLLSSPGETLQLLARATYPDGSTADVTALSKGTDYRTSNAATATVSPEGLVTAVSSGVVLVSAVNEGALAVVRLQVTVSGDSDGDGLPDEWEVAQGLDPSDPADALDDPDRDGLTTLREYQLGLDPFRADSDGDGLLDGAEVARGTDPLLGDSDGDGLWDGLEVQTGSDPLDPASFNLGAALTSIEVSPSAFTIVFNAALGEASRQLTVTGRLLDGRTLDLVPARYGTTYASSSLTIAGFGPEPGRVYAGQDGQATVTVANNGFQATAQVTVSTFAPRALSFLDIPGFANGIALSSLAKDYAFIAAGATGLQVVDISSLAAPRIVASLDTPGNANDVRVEGSLAFLADGMAGLAVIDVANPLAPRLLGQVAGPLYGFQAARLSDLAVAGDRVYVSDDGGLSVFSVSDPAHPALLGSVAFPGEARGLELMEDLAVVAAGPGGLVVIDVSDGSNPQVVSTVATRPDGSSAATDVAVRERLAYVANGAGFTLGGLQIVDLSDPSNPVLLASSGDRFVLTGLALERDLALASDYFFANAVPIFQVGDRSARQQALLDFSEAPSFRDDQGQALAVRDGIVFLLGAAVSTEWRKGLTGSSRLHIGRYATLEDDAGIAPTVELTSPPAGSTLRERKRLAVRATAKDDFRVESVRFLVDGQLISTDYAAPYEVSLSVPTGVSSLAFKAVARDVAGNERATEERAVAVETNTAPEVFLVSPVPGQHAPETSTLTLAAQASDDRGVLRVEFFVDGTLAFTDTVAPYRFELPLGFGARSLQVSAIAYDEAGPSEVAGPVAVTVDPDRPPSAAVLSPRDGVQVPEQSLVEIVAGVEDDLGIQFVTLFLDGLFASRKTAPPFTWTYPAPAGGGTLRIAVEAVDRLGQTTRSEEVVVTSVPDPLTSIRGRVVDDLGVPVAGASVRRSPGGPATTSGPDGSFLLTDLPTTEGDLALAVTAIRDGFLLRGGIEGGISPVPGGIADVGEVVLRQEAAGQTLTGIILDPDGAPVAGAAVKAYDNFTVRTGTTVADGTFAISGLPNEDSLVVSVRAAIGEALLRGVVRAPLKPDGSFDPVTVTLEPVPGEADPKTMVLGQVLGAGGAEVGGAEVTLQTAWDVYTTTTAADGRFSLSDVPALDGDLLVAASALVNGERFTGSAPETAPEPGGTTDIGYFYISGAATQRRTAGIRRSASEGAQAPEVFGFIGQGNVCSLPRVGVEALGVVDGFR